MVVSGKIEVRPGRTCIGRGVVFQPLHLIPIRILDEIFDRRKPADKAKHTRGYPHECVVEVEDPTRFKYCRITHGSEHDGVKWICKIKPPPDLVQQGELPIPSVPNLPIT